MNEYELYVLPSVIRPLRADYEKRNIIFADYVENGIFMLISRKLKTFLIPLESIPNIKKCIWDIEDILLELKDENIKTTLTHHTNTGWSTEYLVIDINEINCPAEIVDRPIVNDVLDRIDNYLSLYENK